VFLINRLHRSSSLERSSRGGEKPTALCASQYEERGSDGAVSPPMGDRRVGFHRCGVQTWYNPSGAVVATCRIATARTRRAGRTVQGNVLSVWQVLHGTSSAPRIAAQRVARFDDYCTSNLLINHKLRQRYRRSIEMALRMMLAFPDLPSCVMLVSQQAHCGARAPSPAARWIGLHASDAPRTTHLGSDAPNPRAAYL
jgi:hypothetical protein